MENPRKLTTRAVGAFLVAALLCLVVGGGLTLARPAPSGVVLPARAIPSELALSNPVAWLSLGVLLMILVPSVRVAGMLLTFRAEEHRRTVGAALVLLALLVGNLALAILATP